MTSKKALLYCCFFISGICGLVYEVLWSRYLSLFIGNTTYAHAIVLATFMGGLALGNLLIGRYADKTTHFLSLYGFIEIIIGLYAFVTPALFVLSRTLFIHLGQNSIPGSLTIQTLKLVLSFPIILFPTFLMGGTLPLVARAFIGKTLDIKREIARLYAFNSFGAVVGSIAAAFILIPQLGLHKALFVTAIVNIFVGFIVLFLKNLQHQEFFFAAQKQPSEIQSETSVSHIQLKVSIIVVALSGLTAMCYEMAWFRFFAIVLGSSTYSFAIMLAAFISGITLGSFILSQIKSTRAHLAYTLLTLSQFVIGFTIVISLFSYERIPFWFSVIRNAIPKIPEMYYLFESSKYALCFLLMLIPTIFFGMTLPLVTQLNCKDMGTLGRALGHVFSINTLGAVVGSLLAGFFLLPLLGMQNTFGFTAALNVCLGAALWYFHPQLNQSKRLSRLGIVSSSLGVLLIIIWVTPTWSYTVLSSGVFRKRFEFKTYKEFRNNEIRKKVLYRKDGSQVTVVVGKHKNGKGLFLKVNGKTDASTTGDLKTQILLGQLPVIFHPNPQAVLNVGIGSGLTIGSALTHPISSIDVIEISKEVLEGSKYFKDYNHAYFNDPRTHIYIEDAKTFLQLTKKKYDVIISEPSNPWISGVGNLFSKEFFQQVKSHLNPKGIFVQWFHIYEMNNETSLSIMRTLHQTFPYISMWSMRETDIIFLASERPLTVPLDELAKKIKQPNVLADLKRVAINDLPSLLFHQIIGSNNFPALITEGPINTDYKPYLEYMAPRLLFYKKRADIFRTIDEKRSNFENSSIYLDSFFNTYGFTEKNLENLHQTIRFEGRSQANLISLATLWQKLYPESQNYIKRQLVRTAGIRQINASSARDIFEYFTIKVHSE